MHSVRQLNLELTNLSYMKGVLETYEEMAATRMQKVRGSLLTSRNFYTGLTNVSDEIGMDVSGVVGEETVIKAYVLLSSNSSMFGDLPERLVTAFAKEIEHASGDVFVIGDLGARLLKLLLPNRDFRALSLPGEELTQNTLSLVLEQLRAYRQIKIIYPQFINLVRQDTSTRELAGELTLTSLDALDQEQKHRQLKYLYEPDLESVGQIMGSEIFGSIFEATQKESELSKFAARLMHLDQSLSNLETWQTKIHKLKLKTRKKIDNKKQGLRVAAAGSYL